MHRSGYAVMLLLYVAALAGPVLHLYVCGTGTAGSYVEGERRHCLLATCGSGPGVICRTLF